MVTSPFNHDLRHIADKNENVDHDKTTNLNSNTTIYYTAESYNSQFAVNITNYLIP